MKKTPEYYADNFKPSTIVGQNPEWPNHTGEEVWKSGCWSFTIKNLGGVCAKRMGILKRYSTTVAVSFDLLKVVSLREWIISKIAEFKAKP